MYLNKRKKKEKKVEMDIQTEILNYICLNHIDVLLIQIRSFFYY